MNLRQAGLIALTLLSASILQVTLLSRLGFPGATPDLVVVTVVAFALAMGPMPGAFAGFLAGVIIDVSPPSDTIVGLNSIVYLAIGFVVGFTIDVRDRTMLTMVAATGFACGAAVLGTSVVESLLGSPRVLWSEVPIVVLTSVLYGGVLGRVMVPFIGWLTRKLSLDATVDA